MAILKQDYRVQVLMIGYDHRFGHNRIEGFEDYVRYGQELGIEVLLAQAYYTDAMTVSSSTIRRLLLQRETFPGGKLFGLSIFFGRYGCERLPRWA